MTDLTYEQRERIVPFLAYRFLESMSLKDLERCFLEVTVENLSGYSDGELLVELDDLTDTAMYAQILDGEE